MLACNCFEHEGQGGTEARDKKPAKTKSDGIIRIIDILGIRKFLPEHREGITTGCNRNFMTMIMQGLDNRDITRGVAKTPVQW